jgi:hypothetical protein
MRFLLLLLGRLIPMPPAVRILLLIFTVLGGARSLYAQMPFYTDDTGGALCAIPTHDDETVMNGAPGDDVDSPQN